MNKKRAEFIYKFTGSIFSRQLHQAPSTSKYAGQKYYRLVVKLENQSTKSISVYRNKLENSKIWKTLHQAQRGELFGKRCIFHCRNNRGFYHLINWEVAE